MAISVQCKDMVIEKSGIPFEAGLQLADLLAIQDFAAAFCTEDMLAVGKGEIAIKTSLKILKKKISTGSRLVLPVNLVARERARVSLTNGAVEHSILNCEIS